MKINAVRTLFALVAGIAISAAFSLSPGTANAADPQYLIVGGAGVRPDYEGSDDMTAFPLAAFRAQWDSGRYVKVAGPKSSGSAVRVEGNILDTTEVEWFELGPVLQYRLARDDVDNNAVDSLRDVDAAVEVGGFFALNFHPFRAQLTGVADASDQYNGSVIELATDYTAEVTDTLSITGGMAATWASSDYMDAYFGVTAAGAAASGLSQFDPDAGVKDIGMRITTVWKGPGNGWEHWRVMGLFSWFGMQKDAKESPIVDDVGNNDQIYGGIAVGWES